LCGLNPENMSTNARLPAGGLLGIDDVLRVLERGGKG